MSRPDWLYGTGCCEHWTPEDGCSWHTGRPAMSLAARELGTVAESARALASRPCEVTMGGAPQCGQPSVRVAAGKPVCATHEESASIAMDCISDVLRGQR